MHTANAEESFPLWHTECQVAGSSPPVRNDSNEQAAATTIYADLKTERAAFYMMGNNIIELTMVTMMIMSSPQSN